MAGGLVRLVEEGEELVAGEVLGGEVLQSTRLMEVVVGGEVVEVVLLLDVDVDRGGGSPSSEDGVSQLTTTLVFLMLNSSGGRPPSSISVSEKKSPQLGPPISKATCASRTWLPGQPRSLPGLVRATSPLPMALQSRTLTIVQKRGNSASLE